VDAATADAQQSEALYRSVLLALQADVAQGYFQVRELDGELQIYRRTVELRGETMRLIQSRYDAGDIGELDLARAPNWNRPAPRPPTWTTCSIGPPAPSCWARWWARRCRCPSSMAAAARPASIAPAPSTRRTWPTTGKPC
jgi:hypothetical protein